MNDSHHSCVQLFWWIREIIAHIEIHSTWHKKSMILKTVPFNYSDEFDKLSHTLTFIAHYIRNEWFPSELCSTILMNSRNYLTHWDSQHIASEMNDSHHSCVQLFWWIREIIAHIEIHGTLHKKWIFLSRVVFNHFDQFKKLSHTLRFIAHCIRNEWFWAEFCLTFLVALWQYSIFREMWEIWWKMSEYNKRYVQILWWLGEATLEIDAHNALHMKEIIPITARSNHLGRFNTMY